MRPQLTKVIVLFIWLSLISTNSTQKVDSSPQQHGNDGKAGSSAGSLSSSSPFAPPSRQEPQGYVPPLSDSTSAHIVRKGDGNLSAKKPPQSHKAGSASAEAKKQGKRLGIWFLGIAGGLQIAAVAFCLSRGGKYP